MKAWKVILAALVIFAAGAGTGALMARLNLRQTPTTPVTPAPVSSFRPRGEVLDRMQRQLYLTPEQRKRVEEILKESNTRMRQLWETIAPEAQEEYRRVNDRIRAELTPEQQTRFEQVLKSRRSYRYFEDHRRREEHRDTKSSRKTNAVVTPAPSAPPTQAPSR